MGARYRRVGHKGSPVISLLQSQPRQCGAGPNGGRRRVNRWRPAWARPAPWRRRLRCRGLLGADPEALRAPPPPCKRWPPARPGLHPRGRRAALASTRRAARRLSPPRGRRRLRQAVRHLPVTWVEPRLGLLGPRPRQAGRRRRPREGWEALTISEQWVVDLVAQGLRSLRPVGVPPHRRKPRVTRVH